MRIAIVGSRKITDEAKVFQVIHQFMRDHTHGNVVIISGGASGIDSIARSYAKHVGYDFIVFNPLHALDEKTSYSPKYFFIRNKQIVQNCDKVLAIWDGESAGTKHTIDYARSLGIPVMVITP